MSYYPEPDSNTKDKIKVVLDLKNHATKKNLNKLQAPIQLLKKILLL